MNFKEKMEARAKEKEARDYFRKNNNEIAKTEDVMKTFLLATIVSGIVFYAIRMLVSSLGVMSGYLYILSAYTIVQAIKQVINKSTTSIKVSAVCGYYCGVLFVVLLTNSAIFTTFLQTWDIGMLLYVMYMYISLGSMLTFLFFIVSSVIVFKSIN